MASFRSAFRHTGKSVTHWYPGHMAKGLKDMQESLRKCDALPISGRNRQFDLLCTKPRLLVMNKADLADPASFPAVRRFYHGLGIPVIYTDCAQQAAPSLRMAWLGIGKEVLRLIDPAEIARREVPHVRILLAGLPNVGKSSIINALRRTYSGRGKAARTGSMPGVTRSVLTDIKINDDPPVYVLDTPGIMLPNIDDSDVALRLALIAALRDDQVGEELIADYLLFTLNRLGNTAYVEKLKLAEPSDDIAAVLDTVARRIGALQTGGVPNTASAAKFMLQKFRDGAYGRMTLDDVSNLPTPAEYAAQQQQRDLAARVAGKRKAL